MLARYRVLAARVIARPLGRHTHRAGAGRRANMRIFLREAVKSIAVVAVCGFLYLRFLVSPVLDFVSRTEWSIIGLVAAILFGGMCRFLIRNGTIMGFLAVTGVILGGLWAEVYFSVPLSHDTAESSSWSAYIGSTLSSTWPSGIAGGLGVIGGWIVAAYLRRDVSQSEENA